MGIKWGKNECERECNCCVEIEESLVLVFCGDIDCNSLPRKWNYPEWEQKYGKPNGGNTVGRKDNDCNCCIEIEESLVVILCGELDANNVKKYLQAFEEVKASKKAADEAE